MPSRDLLDDCEIEAAIQRARYHHENGMPNLCGYTACRNDEDACRPVTSSCDDDEQAHWDEESWSDCKKTPQSLDTPDYYNGDFFDGQLDWNGL